MACRDAKDPEEVDCGMCADSGLMSTLGADLQMEVWPCLCPRGREREAIDAAKNDATRPNDGRS